MELEYFFIGGLREAAGAHTSLRMLLKCPKIIPKRDM
jgi:hypothetical protein